MCNLASALVSALNTCISPRLPARADTGAFGQIQGPIQDYTYDNHFIINILIRYFQFIINIFIRPTKKPTFPCALFHKPN